MGDLIPEMSFARVPGVADLRQQSSLEAASADSKSPGEETRLGVGVLTSPIKDYKLNSFHTSIYKQR